MRRSSPYVAVVGGGEADETMCALAEELGGDLAQRGAVLVCGGLGGVMEAACRGAKAHGGTTVGILPGHRRDDANPFVDIAVATGLGEARNAVIARTVDAVVAVGDGFGTLSEIALALRMGTPVVGLATWDLVHGGRPVPGVVAAASPGEASDEVFRLLSGAGPDS